MTDLFKELNISAVDRLLLLGSPICAIIGSFVHAFVAEMDMSQFPRTIKDGKVQARIRNSIEVAVIMKWLFYRLFIGGAIGFVFSLYFVGISNNDLTSIARILAFAILVGYSAPKLWHSQEKIIKKYVDSKLQEILNTKKDENDRLDNKSA